MASKRLKKKAGPPGGYRGPQEPFLYFLAVKPLNYQFLLCTCRDPHCRQLSPHAMGSDTGGARLLVERLEAVVAAAPDPAGNSRHDRLRCRVHGSHAHRQIWRSKPLLHHRLYFPKVINCSFLYLKKKDCTGLAQITGQAQASDRDFR
jgi:hypothetical protein